MTKYTNEQQDAILSSTINPLTIIPSIAGCVDSKTEYLTKKGWVSINKYSGEDIAIVSSNNELVWSKPNKFIHNIGTFKAYYISNKGKSNINMVLTPDHNTPYYTDTFKTKLQLKPLQELLDFAEGTKPTKGKRKLSGKFLPSGFTNNNKNNILRHTDDELRLLIAIQADGSIVYKVKNLVKSKTKRTIHFNLLKERKVTRLVDLLTKLNAKFTVNKLKSGYTAIHLKSHKYCWFKDLTLLYNCTKKQAKVIYEESVFWDGYVNTRKSGLRTYSYCNTIKKNVDVMQFIYTSATNKAASFSTTKDKVILKGKPFTFYEVSSTQQVQKTLYFEDTKEVQIQDSYCFTTETGLWLARRNNFVFPTGNSGKSAVLEGCAEAHNNNKCMYIVFNKEAQLSSQKIFNSNVKVTTSHALAYYYVVTKGVKLNSKCVRKRSLNKGFGVSNITEDIKLRDKEKVVYWIEKFCQSKYLSVKDYCKQNEKAQKRHDLITKYITLMHDKKIDCTFSFNLKYFQLLLHNKCITFDLNLAMYDEFQDFNAVTLEIVKLLPAKHKVLTGDIHQTLYTFAGAVNGLKYLHDQKPTIKHLTKSFRVPTETAKKIEKYGQLYLDPNFIFKGFDGSTDNSLTAHISRTNSSLIEKMLYFHTMGIPYRLTRSVASIFETIKVIIYLNKKGVWNPKYTYLNRGIDEYYTNKALQAKSGLLLYIKEEFNYSIDIQSAIAIVLDKGKETLLQCLEEAKANARRNEYKIAKTILTSGYTSKGATYSKVILNKDLKPNKKTLKKSLDEMTQHEIEQFSLIYVAYTRCNKEQDNSLLDYLIAIKE